MATKASDRTWLALVVDQGFYSGSNFLFVLAQSRSSAPLEFARFAPAMAFSTLLVAFARYQFHEPWMAGVASVGTPKRSNRGLSFGVFCVVATIALTVASLALLGPGAIGVAVATPVVLMQDRRRYHLIGLHRAERAVFADGLWLLFVAPMLVVSVSVDVLSIWWALGAAASLIATLGAAPWSPRPPAEPAASRTRNYHLLGDFLITELSMPVGLLLLARSSDPVSAATFRAVLIPWGVLWVAIAALRSLGIAHHRGQPDTTRAARAVRISLASAGLAGFVWLLTELVPYDAWVELIGNSWPSSMSIVTAAGVLHLAKASQTGLLLDLKSRARFDSVFYLRRALGLPAVVAGWWVAASGEPTSLMWVLAISECLTLAGLTALSRHHWSHLTIHDGTSVSMEVVRDENGNHQ